MVITQFSKFYKVSCRLCLSFMETFRNILVKFIDVQIGMDRFNLKKKRSFRYENDDEKTKNETIVYKNNRFLKVSRFVNDR